MSAQRASQLVEAGLWLRLSGDHEGAKRLFQQALKLDPSNARARQLLENPPAAAETQDVGPVAKSTMDVDWGLATGISPTPPPLGGAQKSSTRPFGEGAPPGSHTVRLGETTDPNLPPIPEVPLFEPPSPEGEITITGHETPQDPPSTLVFGMSGVPAPPVGPAPARPHGTMVFGGKDDLAETIREQVASTRGTMVFAGKDTPPQKPREPVEQPHPPRGTLVYGGMDDLAETIREQTAPSRSTLMFGSDAAPGPGVPSIPPVAPAPNSTLVFGSGGSKSAPSIPSDATAPNDTLVFGGGDVPAIPPVTSGVTSRTLTFGSAKGAPAAAPRAAPERSASAFDSGDLDEVLARPIPEAAPAITPPPARPSRPTLEFNFDDMVPPPPSAAPPVPVDDGPKTAWDRSNPRIDIAQIGEGEGGGFDLISSQPPPAPKARSPAQLREEVSTLLAGAKDLLDLDDHSGAMELINKALEVDPADAGALRLKDRSERTLQAMYESKLGDLNQMPRVKLKEDEIIWLNLDHRAGFVLAQIDGAVTFEDLFAVSGMSRIDTARILAQLVEEGVITKG